MSMIAINRDPSKRELFWFGALLPVFVTIVGAIAWYRFHAPIAAQGIWIVGGLLSVLFAGVPMLRRPIYLGWMYAALPIGWTVSHLLLGAIYYFVFTPIGLVMRLCGYDPMCRKLDRQATTYWLPRDLKQSSERYFKQF